MLDLSIALNRRILPNLSEILPKSEGMRSFINEGSFTVGSESTVDKIILKNVTLTNLIPYISYDFERLSLSSLESFLSCKPLLGKPRAIGWPILKLYYAAFFAAHAITRAIGKGQFRIEQKQINKLNELATLYSIPVVFKTGTYNYLIIENADNTKDVELNRTSENKGAHEQFWEYFYLLLSNVMQETVANREPESNGVIGEVENIQRYLSAHGNNKGTWLSVIRNQINYQHKYAAWFPYQDSLSGAVRILKSIKIRSSSSIRTDYNLSSEPIESFCSCCELIIAINSDISVALSRQSSAKRFTRQWDRLMSDYSRP